MSAHKAVFGTDPDPGVMLDIHATQIDARDRVQKAGRVDQLAGDVGVTAFLFACAEALAKSGDVGVVDVLRRIDGGNEGVTTRRLTRAQLNRLAVEAETPALAPVAETARRMAGEADGNTAVAIASIQMLGDVLGNGGITRPIAPAPVGPASALDVGGRLGEMAAQLDEVEASVQLVDGRVKASAAKVSTIAALAEQIIDGLQKTRDEVAELTTMARAAFGGGS